MAPIDTRRMAAEIDGGFVVYIDGMRLDELRAVHEWYVAGRKLVRTFERPEADPDSGFLGYEPAFMGLRTGAAIQYWRSLEDLLRFARDRTTSPCRPGRGTTNTPAAGESVSGPSLT